MFGLIRFEPSTVTGPRLLKPASVAVVLIAKCEKAELERPGVVSTVEQLGPLFPSEASTNIPAACVFSTFVRSVSCAQSSLVGQPQLSLITSGRTVGSGFCPARLVGAMKNWKHSV